MKKIIKFISFIAVSAILLAGCIGDGSKTNNYTPVSTNVVMQTGFNEEVYVWESFVFSTNRVDSVK